MNWNSWKWHLVEGSVTYDFTLHLRIRDHTTWFWRCLGTAFENFLLDSHNFMVTALGSCVKRPYVPNMTWIPTRHHFLGVRLGTCVENRVELSANLDPTLNTSPANIFAQDNQDPTIMIINHILMVSWGSKAGTLPPCWHLLSLPRVEGLRPHVNRPQDIHETLTLGYHYYSYYRAVCSIMSFREGGCIQHWNLELWGFVQDSKANSTSSSTTYTLLLCWSFFGWDILWVLKFIVLAEKMTWLISTWIRYWQKYPCVGALGMCAGSSKHRCVLVYISSVQLVCCTKWNSCAIKGPNWFQVVVIHPCLIRGLIGHWPNRSENIIGTP